MTATNVLSHGWGRGAITMLVLAALIPMVSGCGIGVRTRALVGEQVLVDVHVSESANDNSPVAVDLLLIHDEERLKSLLGISARDWFATREQIHRDNPDDPGFEVWSWEWVPGQTVPELQLPLKPDAIGGVLFANYFSPGEHRLRFSAHDDMEIYLLKNDVQLKPLEN